MVNPSRRSEVTVHAPGLLGPWPAALAGDVSRGLDLPGLVGLLARARRAGSRRGAGGIPGIGVGPGRPRPGAGGEVEPPERLAFGVFGYPLSGSGDVPAAELMWEADAAAARSRPRLRPAGEVAAPEAAGCGPRGDVPPRSGDAGGSGPAAAARSRGGERAAAGPEGAFLLRADPVHLRADLDAARLFDASHFSLTREEADAMAGALDRHFAPEGVRFEAPHPVRWYVRAAQRPAASFRPPGGAMARAVGRALPAGSEGSVWRRRMNEVQMVLHAHPANEAREARGALPVNSVWFWGAGRLDDPPRRPRFREVASDDPLVRALGRRGGARVRGLDEVEAQDGLAAGVPGPCLVAPGSVFHHAVTTRDVEGWRRGLVEAERRWFGPLFEAMRAGRVSKATLDAGLRAGAARFEAGGRRMRRPAARDAGAGLAPFLLAEDG